VSTRAYPDRPFVGVGAVIVDGTGRVLLVKRRFEPLAGQWSLPGGAVDVGETLTGCVIREMAEETGLDVEVGPVIEVFDRITRDPDGRVQYHYVLVDYVCRPVGGTLAAASDVADVAWTHLNDLGLFGLTEKATDVIRRGLALAAGEGWFVGGGGEAPPCGVESERSSPGLRKGI
jgi:ADP-ribose pyrophosphatase YjhB (NUDIX family)